MKQVDVLCYRDYTRDGKRTVEHSLLLQDVKLPDKMAADGSLLVCVLYNAGICRTEGVLIISEVSCFQELKSVVPLSGHPEMGT